MFIDCCRSNDSDNDSYYRSIVKSSTRTIPGYISQLIVLGMVHRAFLSALIEEGIHRTNKQANNMTSLVSRLTQSISRAGRDGMALSRAVYGAILPVKRSHPTTLVATTSASLGERIKSVLLEQARREPVPNTLAISVLKIDKEIGLVRYWGLAEYLKQNQPTFSIASLSSKLSNQKSNSSNLNGSGSGGIANDGAGASAGAAMSASSSASTARIAFMITSSMKRDLVDGMGYESSVVKGMTPQQASLVLHHRLAPESYEQEISKLETALEEEQQQQQQEQVLEVSSGESEPSISSKASSIPDSIGESDGCSDSSSSLVTESKSESPLLLSSSSSVESSSLSTPMTPSLEQTESGTDLWYEVVEVHEEGTKTNEIRHGLYKDHEEAVLGLETRQGIHSKREQEAQRTKNNRNEGKSDTALTISFVLRRVSGKDLQ